MDTNALILSMMMVTFPPLLIFAVYVYCGPVSIPAPAPVSVPAIQPAATAKAVPVTQTAAIAQAAPAEPAPPMDGYPEIREAENFHGFRTVHFYESECRRAGQEIRRIPCRSADGAACVALVNSVGGAFDGIDIITADERHCLYSGSVRHGDSFLESLLAKQGFSLSEQPEASAPAAPQLYEETTGEFTQYSFFA